MRGLGACMTKKFKTDKNTQIPSVSNKNKTCSRGVVCHPSQMVGHQMSHTASATRHQHHSAFVRNLRKGLANRSLTLAASRHQSKHFRKLPPPQTRHPKQPPLPLLFLLPNTKFANLLLSYLQTTNPTNQIKCNHSPFPHKPPPSLFIIFASFQILPIATLLISLSP